MDRNSYTNHFQNCLLVQSSSPQVTNYHQLGYPSSLVHDFILDEMHGLNTKKGANPDGIHPLIIKTVRIS